MPPLTHFLVRPETYHPHPSGTGQIIIPQSLIPLVPLDELPEWLDILHVPRHLTPEQTTGLTNVGCYRHLGSLHEVEIVIDDPSALSSDVGEVGDDDVEGRDDDVVQRAIDAITVRGVEEKMGGAGAGAEQQAATTAGEQQQPGLQSSRWADRSNEALSPGHPVSAPGTFDPRMGDMHPADRMMAHVSPNQAAPQHPSHRYGSTDHSTHLSPPAPTNGSKSKSSSSTQTLPAETDMTTRNYCRHWVHHGTCKWGLYCRFEHRMPATLSGLAEVGLRDFPGWWTAAVLGSVHAPPPPPSAISGRKAGAYRLAAVNGLGYPPYGMSGFMGPGLGGAGGYPGLGGLSGLGGVGGLGGGYTRKERQRLKEMEKLRMREKERVSRERVIEEVQEKEAGMGSKGRKVRIEPGLVSGGVSVGVPVMKTMGGEKVGGQVQGQTNDEMQGPAVAVSTGPVVVRGDVPVAREGEKRDGGMEESTKSEVVDQQQQQQQQTMPQVAPQVVPQQHEQKLVDV